VGARAWEYKGAEMSLPATARWDIGHPLVRRVDPMILSSARGTERGP
jgi:hypothetical protein